MKSIKFFTLGCKVNQYDTQAIRELLTGSGFNEIDNGAKADICLINTCTVTGRADAASFGLIRRAKRENPQARVIVTGCLAETDAPGIKKIGGRILIVKNKDKGHILGGLSGHNEQAGSTERGISYFKGHTRAFLKIQDGCNNFCSYCKVPLARGGSRSRPLNVIIREAERLAGNGFKEIVLCGICLGSYGQDLKPQAGLVAVIDALEGIKGLWRIRLSSLEAGDVSDNLIRRMAQSQKLCRHLHIPIQSGDDEILKRMNRSYKRKDYQRLIRRIRKHIPEIAVTTDIMVGFPGESEINFKNTITLVREILPLRAHLFPYSPRSGTAAADFKDRIGPVIIKKRMLRLKNIANACALIYKRRFLGRQMPVLIESRSKENRLYWQGHTDNYIKVRVKSGLELKNKPISLRLNKIVKDYVVSDSLKYLAKGPHL